LKFLIDTHIFLWAIEDSPRLSNSAKVLLENTENQPLLSIASLWEISIKISIGKLASLGSFSQVIDDYVTTKGLQLLNISPEHLDVLASLPLHHRDPFDRLLIAQAIADNTPILTDDGMFAKYAVQRLEF
jgi:PIN domain nuclease of toxin-antitoxin system